MISAEERYEKKRIRVNGVEMAYVEVGEGDPIVFLQMSCLFTRLSVEVLIGMQFGHIETRVNLSHIYRTLGRSAARLSKRHVHARKTAHECAQTEQLEQLI